MTWSLVAGRPDFSSATAAELLRTEYGVTGELRPLPSERDQNFLVTVDGVAAYVLKIANADEDPGVLDLQHAAMAALAEQGVPVSTPLGRIVRRHGHLVRVLTFLPGRVLADVADRPEALLADLGRTMGRVVLGLGGLTHPAADRTMQWDVRRAGEVLGAYLDDVADPTLRALVAGVLHRFTTVVRPRLDGLPHGVIHNDANDHNVLVEGARVTGLLDFGDMLRSVVVHDLAVTCAYAMLDTTDPVAVARTVTAGFAGVRPLSGDERAVLPDLVRTRLATSVAVAAHQSRLDDDPYLVVSAAPAGRLLTRLAEEDDDDSSA